MEQAAEDDGVDGAGDEDDGQSNPEGDAAHEVAGGEQGGALDVDADEAVDDGASDGVDEDLGQAQGPDGLDVVARGVHLVHEGELTHGEAVGEDDVGDGDEGLVEGDVGLGPGGPLDGGQAAGAVGGLDAGGDDGDADGEDDGDEVDVAQDGDLGEAGGHGEEQQDDGGDDGEDDGADVALGDVDEGDGAGQGVGAREEEQLQDEHDGDELIAEAAHHEAAGVGVVGDEGELELDLPDDVGGIDGDEADAHGAQDARDHAEGGEGGGDGEGAEGDGLDDEDDGETLPPQPVELLDAVIVDIPLLLGHLGDNLPIIHGRGRDILPFLQIRIHDDLVGLLVGDVIGGETHCGRSLATVLSGVCVGGT